jgi:HAMP domain-containing protein
MNELLQAYVIDTQFPEVSGIEHLQMLRRRSELAELKSTLNSDELEQLAQADERLVTQASQFLAELSRFVDLTQERRRRPVPASHWWWYLDVLTYAPCLPADRSQANLMPS